MLVFLPIALWVVGVIYGAYSLTLLWSWFIVPFGIRDITFAWAIGLLCLAGLFKGVPSSNSKDEVWLLLAKNFALITLTIVVGFIAHKLM
ncbi:MULTISPECIES: hypothetical protein [unclassified Cedecea]|uniref:hypothetical protein n=1 Tax=unclassified Cedecea TaxID=2649846 RepID=UPI003015B04D